MRKLLLSAAVSASIAVSGCSTTQQANIADQVSAVQQAAVLACSFLPTTATVAGILASLIPGAATIEQVAATTAAQICAAVTPAKGGRLGAAATPTVNGVVVHGRFVK